jgi:putative transposase
VERWFGIITQRAIRRGSFLSVKELITRIKHFISHYNKRSAPFSWTDTADSILEKLQRLCSQISGT